MTGWLGETFIHASILVSRCTKWMMFPYRTSSRCWSGCEESLSPRNTGSSCSASSSCLATCHLRNSLLVTCWPLLTTSRSTLKLSRFVSKLYLFALVIPQWRKKICHHTLLALYFHSPILNLAILWRPGFLFSLRFHSVACLVIIFIYFCIWRPNTLPPSVIP